MKIDLVFNKHEPKINYWGDWARTNIQYRVYEIFKEMGGIEVNVINPKTLKLVNYKSNVVGIDSPQNMTIVNPDNKKAILFNIGPKVEPSFSDTTGFIEYEIVQVIGGSSMSLEWYKSLDDEKKLKVDTLHYPLTFPMDRISEENIAKNYPIDRNSEKIRKAIFIGNLEHATLIGRKRIGDILKKHPMFELVQSVRGMKFKDYLDEMNKYKLSLSLNGFAEMCYRDWESMALSMPIIRSEVYSKYSPELISNYHYISATEPPKDGMTLYYSSDKDIADQFISRVEEVMDKDDYINEIGNNGRKYFEESIISDSIIKHFFEKLNLELLK